EPPTEAPKVAVKAVTLATAVTASTTAPAPPQLQTPTTPKYAIQPYQVRPGDTLAGIAQAQLGSAERYMEIFQLNKDRPQPDGGRLTKPDLIQPGWQLIIPGSIREPIPGPVEPRTKTFRRLATTTPEHSGGVVQKTALTTPVAKSTGGSPQQIAKEIVPADQF